MVESSNRSNDLSISKWQRLFLGMSALGLGIFALLAGYGMGLDENTGRWVLGTFGKVAIVLAMAWLAWPQLLWIKQLPGGGMAIAVAAFGALIFVAKPKLLLSFIPLLLGIAGIFVTITWIQRNLLPPK